MISFSSHSTFPKRKQDDYQAEDATSDRIVIQADHFEDGYCGGPASGTDTPFRGLYCVQANNSKNLPRERSSYLVVFMPSVAGIFRTDGFSLHVQSA